jgi:hypothetical protein
VTRRRPYIRAALAVLLAILAIGLATAGPAAAAPAGATQNAAAGSLSSLGGESPSHPFPLDNYGLDEQVQFGVTHLGNVFNLAIQTLVQSIWFGLLYIFNGIMVMLHWAFSLDLLQNSMSKLGEALQAMREHIDTPWGLAAVAAMALWGIWNGLVRRKSIDTLRGLTASVLCMAALLVVIGNPVETLGQVTGAANGASTEMLDAITGGSVSNPQGSATSTTAFRSRADRTNRSPTPGCSHRRTVKRGRRSGNAPRVKARKARGGWK